MLMREYPRTNKYDPTDIILIDKEQGGTKQLSLGDLVSGENNPIWRAISDAEQEIATRAHAVGDYLIWENTLFKVTSPIQIGNTLRVDGNIEATSISDELYSLNTDLSYSTKQYKNISIDGTYAKQFCENLIEYVRNNFATASYFGSVIILDGMWVNRDAFYATFYIRSTTQLRSFIGLGADMYIANYTAPDKVIAKISSTVI